MKKYCVEDISVVTFVSAIDCMSMYQSRIEYKHK